MDPFWTHVQDQGVAALRRFQREQAPQMSDARINDPDGFLADLLRIGHMRQSHPRIAFGFCPHVEPDPRSWIESGKILHIFQCGDSDCFLCDECVKHPDAEEDILQGGMPDYCAACGGNLRRDELVLGFAWSFSSNIIHSYLCIACEYYYFGMTDQLRNNLLKEGTDDEQPPTLG